MRGKFITLECLDGAGKSTHLARLVELLKARGKTVVQPRERGGTPLVERTPAGRADAPGNRGAADVRGAARAPCARHRAGAGSRRLGGGDRFTDASFAYQGGGRGLAAAKLATLEAWVQDGLDPDLTLLFEVPTEVALGRVQGMGRELDRFEREKSEFFERVRAAYLERARAAPARIRVIAGSRSLADVGVVLEDIVSSVCK